MRIAIVNDMTLAVEALRRVISSEPDYTVAWIARDGCEAVQLCREDKPDLVLMDLMMPNLNGVEATHRIMADSPCPILVVTSSVGKMAPEVFEALGAGALDAIGTPVMGPELDGSTLLRKVRQLGRLITQSESSRKTPKPPDRSLGNSGLPLVVLGASSGGPRALVQVLRNLPKSLSAAIVVVQHIDYEFVPGLVTWLGAECKRKITPTKSGKQPQPGDVWVAATQKQLSLSKMGQFKHLAGSKDSVYQPSIDVFFESVALNWKGPAIGVILSGMGSDGAKGLHKLRLAGHHTIAQDEKTSTIFGMPKAAVQRGAACEVLPLKEIADSIASRVNKMQRTRKRK